VEVEVDPVVRHHSREALGDPLEFEKRRFRHGEGSVRGGRARPLRND
jgi:hypothetical protein